MVNGVGRIYTCRPFLKMVMLVYSARQHLRLTSVGSKSTVSVMATVLTLLRF
jgi:hypothetical protein